MNEMQLRSLQYRLQRQGMLELDVWLSGLKSALQSHDKQVIASVERLLQMEVPDLLAMQTGQKPVPKELKPWLGI